MAAIIAYKVITLIVLAVATGASSGIAIYYHNQAVSLNNQVTTLNQNANTLASQIDALKAAIANLTQQITLLQSSNARLVNQTSYLQTLNSELTAQNTQLQTLQTKLSDLVNQVSSLNVQLGAQVLQLQTEVGQLQLQVSQLKTIIAALNQTGTIITLSGAGAALPLNLFAAINANYTGINPNIRINYQAVGSLAGVILLDQKLVDFAASDAPPNFTPAFTPPNSLTIPETVGAVVLAYNLPGIPKGLHLDATVAAEILQGNVTTWNAPAIQQLNPATTLPSNPITVVHRADASMTTFELSDYLNSSTTWKLGISKTLHWPIGSVGAIGDPGVEAVVQGTAYAVGYVGLNQALSAPPLTYAYLRNPAGAYVEPTLSSVELAASSLSSFPAGNGDWSKVNLINTNNPAAYPITYLSYVIVYQELNVYSSTMTLTTAQALVNYLWFVIHDGQNQAVPNLYPPLPSPLVSVDETTIRSMTYNSQVLHA